jgi:putative membrane protein
MMDWGDWGAAGWILMSVSMVVFWGLIALGIVWLVRATGEGRGAEHPEHGRELTPVEALDRSLAEGRIDVEDYKERRRVLTGST